MLTAVMCSVTVANVQTRIRVRFADRSQLEGVFPSTDKMIHIYEFVRLAIAENHRAKPFMLCKHPSHTNVLYNSFSQP